MEGLARWCLRRRGRIASAWLLILVGLITASSAVGPSYRSTFAPPRADSTRATELLASHFPGRQGDTDFIVVHSAVVSVTDPTVLARVSTLIDEVGAIPHVTNVSDPYRRTGQVSADGRTAFATVQFDASPPSLDKRAVRRVLQLTAAAGSPDLQVDVTGPAVGDVQRTQPGPHELIGVAAAGIVLFLAFGSMLGMLLPLLCATVALGCALSIVVLMSHVADIAEFAPGLAALVGLGAGIDYALFIVSRYRENLCAGMSCDNAVAAAVITSGRAGLFAGITVCVAVLGMLALQVAFLTGMAIAASLAVLLAMAAALTLLPALLGFLGLHVLSRREQERLRSDGPHAPHPSGAWMHWAVRVQHHPWQALLASLVVIGLVTAPVASLRLGNTDQGNDPAASTTRRAYDLLTSAFGPGFNGPFLVAVDMKVQARPDVVTALTTRLASEPGVAAIGPVTYAADGRAAILDVYPTTSPQSTMTLDLLRRIRVSVIPRATLRTGIHAHVGGGAALRADFSTALSRKLPEFIGAILLLSILLLVAVFRSVVVPLKAALLNLLSLAGAFGAVTAVFQWGWGADLLGIRPGPIEVFLPVMLFAILFGLSMDYEVFLVSRIREEWVRTNDNALAVTRGLAATGRLITAAAAIMIVVFGSFILGGERVIKLFGFGFAVAVMLDALVIRSVLAPALMHLAGRANWGRPARFDRAAHRCGSIPHSDRELRADDDRTRS
jgi:RND superfamily putative drug exporter